MQQYMIIERFDPGSLDQIYQRLAISGRRLPDGLKFVESWLTKDNTTVFQVMETDDPQLFHLWFKFWDDLVTFEIIPLRDKPGAT